MDAEFEQSTWQRDEDGVVDKVWVGAMLFLAVSVLTCVMPLLPEKAAADGIMVRESGATNPEVAFMSIESPSIFPWFKKEKAEPKVETVLSIEPSLEVDQFKEINPALLMMPAAKNRFIVENGELRERPIEVATLDTPSVVQMPPKRAKKDVRQLIEEAYKQKGVDSDIFDF